MANVIITMKTIQLYHISIVEINVYLIQIQLKSETACLSILSPVTAITMRFEVFSFIISKKSEPENIGHKVVKTFLIDERDKLLCQS